MIIINFGHGIYFIDFIKLEFSKQNSVEYMTNMPALNTVYRNKNYFKYSIFKQGKKKQINVEIHILVYK